ncbi:hypothetical protein, partial [Bradyrhizobium cenepequi]|uniref:hypothetical protein n=1 Tax=Bradyrhizobium cenepequi TaxID=2821403 RepID=UPI001CE2F6BE
FLRQLPRDDSERDEHECRKGREGNRHTWLGTECARHEKYRTTGESKGDQRKEEAAEEKTLHADSLIVLP